jgi:hypothetical protein
MSERSDEYIKGYNTCAAESAAEVFAILSDPQYNALRLRLMVNEQQVRMGMRPARPRKPG